MSVRKRRTKHGVVYRADWRDASGVRIRKDFRLQADAETFEREQRLQAKGTAAGGPAACDPKITLAEYAQRWLSVREAQGIDRNTIVRQEVAIRRHIVPRLGSVKVRALTRTAVRSFLLAKLSEQTLSRGSVKQVFATVSALLSEATEERLVTSNVVAGLWRTLSKGKAGRKNETTKVKALDAEQAAAFLTVARETEPRFYPCLATMTYAGLRPGEALGVRADRIDFAKRTLLVDGQIVPEGGYKGTKTGASRRVDLSRALVEVLRDACASKTMASAKVVSITGAAVAGEAEVGPWLLAPELGALPSRSAVYSTYKGALRAMRRVLRRAGLPGHHTLHSLRHTFCSLLIAAGVSPAYVQQQAGHADMSFTVRVYASWFPVRSPGSVDALAEALGGRGHQKDTRRASEQVETA
jgi:integrase